MFPVVFEVAGYHVYSYGLMIAIGAMLGVGYMAVKGKKEVGLTFDQANSLFLFIFFAAVIGGKVFLFFEDPSYYFSNPAKLIKGSGFVFYGSFLLAIPAMLWFFKKNNLNALRMLDVMAVTTCLVHIFGRFGCFLAGCCHGKPTNSSLAVTFTDPGCFASPKGVPLHPSQLYEALFIFITLIFLLYLGKRRKFYGQLFLVYLISYAVGRFTLEFYRGDSQRGFILETWVSNSQFIALIILVVSVYYYRRWSSRHFISELNLQK